MKIKLPILLALLFIFSCSNEKIDRQNLVNRHNVKNTSTDSLSTLTVGNGNFAFSVDITGMQTFPQEYKNGISLGTLSNRGWHSFPNKRHYTCSQVLKSYLVNGRTVKYIHRYSTNEDSLKSKASEWLRENPHRLHLGLIGLEIKKKDGSDIAINDIQNPQQNLDLWQGLIESYFEIEGVPVKIMTVCHPTKDLVSVHIESDLISMQRLKIIFRFPDPSAKWENEFKYVEYNRYPCELITNDSKNYLIKRRIDTTLYYLDIHTRINSELKQRESQYILSSAEQSNVLDVSCLFSPVISHEKMPEYSETKAASAENFENYWMRGGVVDFSGCTDSRASELERRVVLSQYLMKVNCSGNLPPQETGLTMNSWYGKFHLEMHWWHSAQFAFWNRTEILEKQMQFYSNIKSQALERAKRQGYEGVRWPKMIGPDGIDSPSSVATYLIWQQPHPIWFAEAIYKNTENKKHILEKYKSIVFETADFMASFVVFDSTNHCYNLVPPLIPAQERFKAKTTVNPAFELAYWYWGLNTAIKWAERLNVPIPKKWIEVKNNLAPLPKQNNLYLFTEDAVDSYSNKRYLTDHPMVLGCLGMLQETKMVDREVMRNTFDSVYSSWVWKDTWGWDFPLAAMTAAELGYSDKAIDILFMDIPTNTYLTNGHNYQDERLPIYLPGNGGLLTAIAKMCVKDQFPKNGKWNVKWENLNDL